MKTQKRIKRWAFLLTLLLCIGALALPAAAATDRPVLTLGGVPFGVRFTTEGILVVSYCDVHSGGRDQNPARDAGLRPGDCICRVGEHKIETATELTEVIQQNGQQPLTLFYKREGREQAATLTPLPCDEDGRLRTGLFVRDAGAGIGTVTFVREDGSFGGLGHGICDGESGALIPLSRGSVMGVTLGDIHKGVAGTPGELRGHFSAERMGVLTQNTACGVFGHLTTCPTGLGDKLPIAYRNEVCEGAATLRCTLDNGAPREYTVEITAIRKQADGNKCFTVHVTDPDLLAKTGGIVQGMSGSPIIQDGKIVGAVTHVLINDPTTGYGIFIENMLSNMAVALS
ncbi:MAG: SpoIVB peptidase [Clostridia bacterium]|nr:SpoIVB peptidase [Clostridia bacterium]